MSTQGVTLNSCGCCVGPSHLGPDSEQNPPALSAIIYRAGTFGGFRRSMLSVLSSTPGVAGLTTREPEDPAVGLVDAWSVALDVLTFYQERIANEGSSISPNGPTASRIHAAPQWRPVPSPRVQPKAYFQLPVGPLQSAAAVISSRTSP